MKYSVYAFDFDGTLTKCDSFKALIVYCFGVNRFIKALLRFSPQLLKMKLGLLSGGEVKEKIFSYFFSGMTEYDFTIMCEGFAKSNRKMLRKDAVEYLESLAGAAEKIVIVSASMAYWIKPLFKSYNNISFACTEPEIICGKLTGRFATPNCKGREKVVRLLKIYPQRDEYQLIAFGDSRGDRELLAYADKSYFKPFKD